MYKICFYVQPQKHRTQHPDSLCLLKGKGKDKDKNKGKKKGKDKGKDKNKDKDKGKDKGKDKDAFTGLKDFCFAHDDDTYNRKANPSINIRLQILHSNSKHKKQLPRLIKSVQIQSYFAL